MIAVARLPGDDDEHEARLREAIVRRIDELAELNRKEWARRRPAHRPPAPVSTGRDVALLVESNVSLDRAKAIIAEKRGLKPRP